MSILYLIPCTIDDESTHHIPPVVYDAIKNVDLFVVERARTARRFIKKIIPTFLIDNVEFFELDKHDMHGSLNALKKHFIPNKNIGLISEAGTPCIADPGGQVVNIARSNGYEICPLTGPSSIILGLMSSGMNGQHFTFHGYLPIKEEPLIKKLKDISSTSNRESSTQIFIETPYRNQKLLEKIRGHVDKQLYLSVAIKLTGRDQKVITKKIAEWTPQELDKSPALFCIGKLLN